MTKKQKWGIVLLVAPFLFLIVSIILGFVRQMFGAGDSVSIARTIINIITILIGFVGVVGLLPGIAGGIILLVTGGDKQMELPTQQYQQPASSDEPKPPANNNVQ